MKLEKILPGMTLYHVGTYKMGNTTMRSVGVWPAYVVSVDVDKRTIVARWNGNEARTYRERDFRRWREKRPELVREGMRYRLQTRWEKKAAQTQPHSK